MQKPPTKPSLDKTQIKRKHVSLKQSDAGRLPLVMVHGFMQTGDHWANVAPLFDDAFDVVAPTLSPSDAQDASIAALATALVDVAEAAMAAAGSTSYVLLGYSMGGRVALEVARRHSARIRALVLESAGLGPKSERDRRLLRERNADMAARLKSEGLESFATWWETLPLFASQCALPDTLRAEIRSARVSCDAQSLALLLEHAGAHTMPLADETRAMLADAPFPVLYVAGAVDDAYARLAASLPETVEVACVEGCGHNVHLERPREFACVVRSFLGA